MKSSSSFDEIKLVFCVRIVPSLYIYTLGMKFIY